MPSDDSPASPGPAGTARPAPEASNNRFGVLGLCALLLALGVRAWFVLSGRSPMDGDEAIMAMMAHHLGELERLPLHFYGQHYIGSLEIPLLAIVQKLGPEWWTFGVWPIRLTQTVYFSLFFYVHFKLVARFFGARAAHWSLLFVALGPAFWTEYSMHMRHVVPMMAVGELMALVTLGVVDKWNDSRVVLWRSILFLGFLGGIGWWHYQLILVYFVGAAVLAIFFSSFGIELVWPRAGASRSLEGKAKFSSSRSYISRMVCLLCVAFPPMAIVAISMGKFARYWQFFWIIVPATLVLAVAGWAMVFRLYRSERESRVEAHDPALPPHESLLALVPSFLSVGFFLGALPLLLYLVLLDEEFWIVGASLDLSTFFDNLRYIVTMEIGSLFELTGSAAGVSGDAPAPSAPTPRVYMVFALIAMGLYFLGSKLFRPDSREERCGAVYFFVLGMTLILFRVLFYRPVPWSEPRFLIPLVPWSAAVFGLLFENVTRGIRPPAIRLALVPLVVLGCVTLWGPGWRSARVHDIDRKTGHRKLALEIAEALEVHEVERLYVQYASGSTVEGWIPLGWEIMWAGRMNVRANAKTFGDRLWGLIDESRYEGPVQFLYAIDGTSDPRGDMTDADFASPSFRVAGFGVIPLPEGYRPSGGWRKVSAQ